MTHGTFLSPLRAEKLDDNRWRLLEPLRFQSMRFAGVLVAPAGFVTDFASTPRIVWMWWPKDGPWSPAAVLHDAGYHHALQTADGRRVHLIKRFADDLFDEGLRAKGVGWWTRVPMVAAVRGFGTAQVSEVHKEAGWLQSA